MTDAPLSRRSLLQVAVLGLAVPPPQLLRPTESCGVAPAWLAGDPPTPADPPADGWKVTESAVLGPYHRPDAPFRAKISPPLAQGTTLLVRGRVYGIDQRAPLANAIVDVWQADHAGRYDNDDPAHPPAADSFRYRARMVTDRGGGYEFESVVPGNYELAPGRWRARHIHVMVQRPGYRTLVTQLFFADDPRNAEDGFIKPSLIVPTRPVVVAGGTWLDGTFDLVLAKG